MFAHPATAKSYAPITPAALTAPGLRGVSGTHACKCASPWASTDGRQYGAEMFDIYRATGGLATADEVARLLREHDAQPISLLARWIVKRQVASFVWHGEILLPLFQFDMNSMCVRLGIPQLISALFEVFDDRQLSAWFVEPNMYLSERAPAEVMTHELASVLQAAHAARHQMAAATHGRAGEVQSNEIQRACTPAHIRRASSACTMSADTKEVNHDHL